MHTGSTPRGHIKARADLHKIAEDDGARKEKKVLEDLQVLEDEGLEKN